MTLVDLRDDQLDHRSFAALLPSQQKSILERVTRELPWLAAELVTFVVSTRPRCFVVVRLALHRGGQDEFVVWDLSFGRRGPVFVNGRYGFVGIESAPDAVREMTRIASES